MRRREFVVSLCGSAAAWPFALYAQTHDKPPTVAILGDRASVWGPWTDAFIDRMRELGWVEGRNLTIEYRWSEGQPERAAEIANELIQQNVSLIVTYGGAATKLKQATASIPIVFAIAVDPVGIGLVASFSHPGGNITGLSVESNDLAGKRLELFREIVPSLHRLAVMFDESYPAAALGSREVHTAAATLGIDVEPCAIQRAEDIAPTFAALKARADAIYVVENALVSANSKLITTLALETRLPMMFNIGTTVQLGTLISYGPDFPHLFRRAADYTDKILHGTKPADLPIEQPTKFNLVLNLKTAKVLGLTVPDKLLALADEVIE